MKSIFVDTGAWIALTTQRDQLHRVAAAYARRLSLARIPLLTTNYVLVGAYTHIRYNDGHPKALEFDSILQNLTKTGRLTVTWVIEEVHAQALEIFRKYTDQAFSVVDCASFVVARDGKIREVFGFDKHFLTMGFVLKPGATLV